MDKERERRRRQRQRSRKRKAAALLKSDPSPEVKRIRRKVVLSDLDQDQQDAYKMIHDWWHTQLRIGGVANPLIGAGLSGTGKTTLLGLALPALENPDGSKPRIKYATFTGKAASVMFRKGMDASTIHFLIYNWYPQDDGSLECELKDPSEVEADLLVIDEGSMVPEDLREEIASLGIPTIYTGDHGQLNSIEGRSNFMENADFKLEKVHRQALESGIIEMSTFVRAKKRVANGVYGNNKDAIKIGKDAIADTGLLSVADIVICNTNKVRQEINERIRAYRGYSGSIPQVGDKLVCTRNNRAYKMFNGLITFVEAITVEDKTLIIDMVDEVGDKYPAIKVFPNHFEGLEHPKIHGNTSHNIFEYGYAVTCHKAQGSEWENVVVIEEAMSRMRSDDKRRWMYTALTRASNHVTWISKFR